MTREGGRTTAVDGAGHVLADRYRLLERIASGGMASVWRGYDETLARHVAIKVLHEHLAADDAFRQRFRREAVSAARLTHPNIVGVYDTGYEGQRVWLVMELVEGPTLRDSLARTGPMDPARVATIGERVARALDYAHQNGIVHRDVKPGNILLGDDSTVKVADFGIAKVEGSDEITRTGTMLGTAAYVSPEQLRGQRLDGATDQYSLACVLFEALTGRLPFEADSAVATASRRLEAEPTSPASLRDDLPAGLGDVVLRALASERGDRYPGADALADALAPYAHNGGSRGSEHVRGPQPERRTRHQRRPPRGESPAAGDAGADRARTPSAAGGRPATAPGHDGPTPSTPEGGAASAGRDAGGQDGNAAAADAEPSPGSRSGLRGDVRWLAVGLGLVLAAASLLGLLAAFFVDMDGLLPSLPTESGDEVAEAAEAIAPAEVGLFDPEGGSSESPEGLDNLLDGDPGTGWNTVGYNTPAFGNLKSGVGYWMDLGEAHRLELVALRSTTPGVTVEIRVADRRAATPAGWRRVSAGQAQDGLTEFRLDDVEARYVLVWVTGRLQPDGSGRYRAGFAETAVVGRPP